MSTRRRSTYMSGSQRYHTSHASDSGIGSSENDSTQANSYDDRVFTRADIDTQYKNTAAMQNALKSAQAEIEALKKSLKKAKEEAASATKDRREIERAYKIICEERDDIAANTKAKVKEELGRLYNKKIEELSAESDDHLSQARLWQEYASDLEKKCTCASDKTDSRKVSRRPSKKVQKSTMQDRLRERQNTKEGSEVVGQSKRSSQVYDYPAPEYVYHGTSARRASSSAPSSRFPQYPAMTNIGPINVMPHGQPLMSNIPRTTPLVAPRHRRAGSGEETGSYEFYDLPATPVVEKPRGRRRS